MSKVNNENFIITERDAFGEINGSTYKIIYYIIYCYLLKQTWGNNFKKNL